MPVRQGMPASRLDHRDPGAHFLQDQARLGQFPGSRSSKLLKGAFFNHYFTQYNEADWESPGGWDKEGVLAPPYLSFLPGNFHGTYNEIQVNSQTVLKLLSLNKQFYQTFGYEFSSTRLRLQPGVLRVVDGLAGEESILDLGCGNGEMARELMRRGHRGPYTGVDFSPALLEIARHGWEDAPAAFVCIDLSNPNWDKKLVATLTRPFDLVTAFATLHHIPGREMRLNILTKVRAMLRPGGRFIHSEWQFMSSEKLKDRIQPWKLAKLDPQEVEEGDFLLDWRSGGRGLRYVHLFSEEELEELAASCRFRVRQTFLSDGTNGKLGLYQIWETA